jgi:hypothetical protein
VGRYSFEVSSDGETSVEVGLFPTNGEAVHQARTILIGYVAAQRPAAASCTVSKGTGDSAKLIGQWRYAHDGQPAWEPAQGHQTVLEFRTAARFMREAQVAEATARSLADPELRQAFTDLAQQWRELARRAGPPDDR